MYNNTIIFCQAPADIPYLLDIYEKTKESNKISIYVINVKGLYIFLSDLNLTIEKLEYIPYKIKNLKNIYQLINERSRINRLWNKNFNPLENCNVYFFSRFEDWLTAAFIHRFSKKENVKISYLDHYDDSALLFRHVKKINYKKKIYQLILKFLTGIKFNVEIIEKLPEFPISEYSINKFKAKKNPEIFVKYSYSLDKREDKSPSVLFFVSPCEKAIFNPINYDAILIEIVKIFEKTGFRIIIKGHPRIGTPDIIKNIDHIEIPSYIPGEFINSNQIELCIGLYTTAICHFVNFTNLSTYSIIKLFEASNSELYNIGINFLKQQTEGRIQFCENLKELETITRHIRSKFDERHTAINNNNNSSI